MPTSHSSLPPSHARAEALSPHSPPLSPAPPPSSSQMDQMQARMRGLEDQLSQLKGEPSALEKLSLAGLQEVEQKLDDALRSTREVRGKEEGRGTRRGRAVSREDGLLASTFSPPSSPQAFFLPHCARTRPPNHALLLSPSPHPSSSFPPAGCAAPAHRRGRAAHGDRAELLLPLPRAAARRRLQLRPPELQPLLGKAAGVPLLPRGHHRPDQDLRLVGSRSLPLTYTYANTHTHTQCTHTHTH
jgi:hypothetical protein